MIRLLWANGMWNRRPNPRVGMESVLLAISHLLGMGMDCFRNGVGVVVAEDRLVCHGGSSWCGFFKFMPCECYGLYEQHGSQLSGLTSLAHKYILS